MKKINGFDIGLLLVMFSIFFLFRFANARNDRQEIQDIQVKFIGNENHFLTQEMVNNLLKQNFANPSVINREALNLKDYERKLDINRWVAHSEVYVDISGNLHAEVEQKKALARVIDNGMSYYVSMEGDTMPLSANFSPRVPLVTGILDENNDQDFIELLRKITEDEFLKEMITGIQINPDQTLNLTSRAHRTKIEIRKKKDMERKLTNYKIFLLYKKNDTIIQQNKNINLRITKQVICTKQYAMGKEKLAVG